MPKVKQPQIYEYKNGKVSKIITGKRAEEMLAKHMKAIHAHSKVDWNKNDWEEEKLILNVVAFICVIIVAVVALLYIVF